jgi:glycosyltransferase involved in cell wall biosynthesis
MKLLFVHDRFGAMGGAESNIFAVAHALREKGHRVAILHGPGTGRAEDRWRELFHECHPLEKSRKCESIQSALWQFEPDALYVHKISDLDVLKIITGCGVPAVRMVHDHDMYCMRSYKYDWLSRKICTRPASLYCVFRCGACLSRNRSGFLPFRWVSYRAKRKEIALNRGFSRLVVASQYMRQELLRNGFDPGSIEVHPPVPCAAEDRITSSFSDRNLIIYCGQIIRGKGVDVLLRALQKVTMPFECVIIGDGNHRPYCEQLAQQLGLGKRVRFTGFAPQDELLRNLAEASVSVMSSVWPEPYGSSGLEAMRYGLPVVAFDAGAIKEWLIDGANGFVVPWMDTQAFASRIDQLLSDKLLARRLGEKARASINAPYEFSKYIDGLEHLFARLCEVNCEEVPVLRSSTAEGGRV